MKTTSSLISEFVPVSYAAALLTLAEALGVSREVLFAGAGFNPEAMSNPHGRLPLDDFNVLVSTAMHCCDEPALGLLFGQRLNISAHGILGYALLASANLGDALQFALKYYRVLGLAFELELVEGEDWVQLRATETLPLGALGVFAAESLLASLYGIATFLLHEPLQDVRIGFAHEAPAYAPRYAQVFAVPVSFAQTSHFMTLPSRYLQRPMALANPATVQMCEQQCEALLVGLDMQDGLLVRLRRLLLARPGNFPDMDAAARMLHTTGRSLRRHLARLGTSYQEVLDEVRKRLALQYLATTRLPAAEIAYLLGFSDASNFRRAFKKWTGKLPGECRKGFVEPQ